MLRTLSAFAFLLITAVSCETETTDYGPIDKKIIEDYLADNNLTAQSTASGLYYIIEKPGGVNHPNINSLVTIHYKGYLTDGTVFDESYSDGSPTTQPLSVFIKGWQEGLQLIGIKGTIKLLIPSALAYGSTSPSTKVPANSVLIFDIELLEFY